VEYICVVTKKEKELKIKKAEKELKNNFMI
jgi:hypothetical protein